MPEWAIYVLIAIMWIIGLVLVIVFVLIMYFVFGKQLKKLGFHVSVKDGIGVDVETHQPINTTSNQPTTSPKSLRAKSDIQVLPASQDTKSARKPIKYQSTNTQSLEITDRIKHIASLFDEQLLSGDLFGWSGKDNWIRFDPGKISTLPNYLLSKFDIHIITYIEMTKASPLEGYWDKFHYSELFVICVNEVPANRKKWTSDLKDRASLIGDDAIIWVVVSNNFPKDLRATIAYTFDKPKILTSPLIDLEAIERRLLQG